MNRIFPVIQSKLPVILMVMLLSCIPLTVYAALPAYMTVTGEIQGIIENDSAVAQREGQMVIIEFGHSVSQGIDSATGLPAGDRQHRAIRVIKEVDSASPKLMTAMTLGENLTSVVFRFYRPSSGGQEIQYYTIQLVNAHIINISTSSRSYDGDDWTTVLSVPTTETLTFSYQKILWTWEDGGVTSEDDWDQANP